MVPRSRHAIEDTVAHLDRHEPPLVPVPKLLRLRRLTGAERRKLFIDEFELIEKAKSLPKVRGDRGTTRLNQTPPSC
jgi:hypothetical protein